MAYERRDKRLNSTASHASVREKIEQDLATQVQDLAHRASHHAEDLLSHSFKRQLTAELLGSTSTKIVDSGLFNLIVTIMIGINTVQLGLSVDYPEWSEVWFALEHVFTAFFLIEMILKLISLRMAYFDDAWNRMDCLLASMSVFDNWIMPIVIRSASEMGKVSVLRIVRVCRLVRVARALKVFKELWLILKGIMCSLRIIFWVITLLVLTLYVCSIFCVEILGRKMDDAGTVVYPGFDDDEESIEASAAIARWNNYAYFGTVPRSMYTLFNVAVLTEFTEFTRPVLEKQPAMILFFLAFVSFTTFGLLNVIIGNICESTMEATRSMEMLEEQHERQMRMTLLDKIIEVTLGLDVDRNGTVSFQEMVAGWNHPAMADVAEQMKLPPGFGAKEFMFLVDMDGDGAVSVEELMTNFYRTLCYDPFHSNCCMHSSLNQVKTQLRQVQTAIQGLEENQREMRQDMQDLKEMVRASIAFDHLSIAVAAQADIDKNMKEAISHI